MRKLLIDSPFGQILLIAGQGCLVYCNWISSDCANKQSSIENMFQKGPDSEEDIKILDNTAQQLSEYFKGTLREFNLPVQLTGTSFQKKVWQLLKSATYAHTLSYKEIALLYGNPKAVRAVARACGANPLAIIMPCHRIIASHGKLGGYTGGIDKKIALLSLEQMNVATS